MFTWPEEGEDSYVVEVADLTISPSMGYLVGPFREKEEAEAWKPEPGTLVTGIRQLHAP